MQRLLGLAALLIVLALVLGIERLARGAVGAGVAILAGVLTGAAAIGWLLARRARRRPR